MLDLIITTIVFLVLLAQIFIQFSCAVYALCAKKVSRQLNGFWYYAAAAFALMGLRRVTAMLLQLEPVKEFFSSIYIFPALDRVILPLTVSILLLIGLKGIFGYVKREAEYKESLEIELESNIKELKRLSAGLKRKKELQ